MKVILTRANRIDGRAGETVEVDPARAAFLLRYGLALAVPADDTTEQVETPERAAQPETPERTVKAEKPEAAVKKTTRKAKK